MKGTNNVIVCDSCKRVGEPAYPARISLGICKNKNRPAESTLLFHRSCRDKPIDLCEQCGKLLADKIAALICF